MLFENVTCWEGKYRKFKRFLKLQTAVKKGLSVLIVISFVIFVYKFGRFWSKKWMSNEALLGSLKTTYTVILNNKFWIKLQQYLPILKKFHVISKMAQDKHIPTGSSIPFCTWELQELMKPKETDSVILTKTKHAFKMAIDSTIGHYLTKCSNFMCGAAFDARYSHILTEIVFKELVNEA